MLLHYAARNAFQEEKSIQQNCILFLLPRKHFIATDLLIFIISMIICQLLFSDTVTVANTRNPVLYLNFKV